MEIKVKIDMLRHSMDRYDHYYDSVNNKGNFFLALNTFLLGGILTGYYTINNEVQGRYDILFFALVGLICCLLSITFTLWAIFPYLTKQADSENGSVLYFGNVANVSFTSFKKMYDEITDEKMYQDYIQQNHLLAIGLQKKFNRLQIAAFLLGACFICIIIIGLKF